MHTASAITGWVLSWFVVIQVLMSQATTCTMGSTDSWLASAILGLPLILVALALLFWGRDCSRFAKWFALPHLVLLPLAGVLVAEYLWDSTILDRHFCSIHASDTGFDDYPRDWWNRLWAPGALGVLLVIVYVIWTYWRPVRRQLRPTQN